MTKTTTAKTVKAAHKSSKSDKSDKIEKSGKLGKSNKIILPDDKQKIIEDYAQKKGDTGSPEVQVALLSHKIGKLSEHLDINKKDNHSRRGLLKVIAKRRRILNYLQKLDEKRYKKLIEKLGLKK